MTKTSWRSAARTVWREYDTKHRVRLIISLVVIMLVLGFVALFVAGLFIGQHATDAGAISVCEQATNTQLRSPASASYSNEAATHAGNDYTVTGAVDSDNALGTPLRSTFVCHATYVSGDTWAHIVSLVTPS